MTRPLRLRPLTAEAFAPFGDVVDPPALGARPALEATLGGRRADAVARLAFNHVEPVALPLLATEMERHLWSSQAFVPLDVARWVLLVAPDAGGRPDPAGLRGFLARGDQAVNYHVGTWHHPLRVLDRPGRFAVLMWATGRRETDEEWSPLPEPVRLEA